MKIKTRNHKLLKQIPGELEHLVEGSCNQNCTLDEITNTLKDIRKMENIVKYSPYKGNSFRVNNKNKPREKMAGVTKKKNSCHDCGSTDRYSNNCPKEKKEIYTIETAPEEEIKEDSESDSMGDSIRKNSDDDQDLREEFLVE
ncbi:hypothetical protein O181_034579 [Austropuccinia psidii MF-1]|uniref:CCHC-type domain-containing protein n=1 Tax=Austropuccinia psidii MF-1 TaxID=1389203 RepID=A0A9Q3D111_9BASI|nr:hypothetical protein [Austropuccinia psidii MF-1]